MELSMLFTLFLVAAVIILHLVDAIDTRRQDIESHSIHRQAPRDTV